MKIGDGAMWMKPSWISPSPRRGANAPAMHLAEEEGFVLFTPTENNQVIDFRFATNAKSAENAMRGHNLGTRKSSCIAYARIRERLTGAGLGAGGYAAVKAIGEK